MPKQPGNYWLQIRLVGFALLIEPLILFGLGYVLLQNGFQAAVPNYDEGAARYAQYALFAFGVAIFFFCDGISSFLARKLLSASQSAPRPGEFRPENLVGYMSYTFVMMSLLNLISLTGFIGFLICANLTWLGLFALLDIGIKFKYYPSPRRLAHLTAQLTTTT